MPKDHKENQTNEMLSWFVFWFQQNVKEMMAGDETGRGTENLWNSGGRLLHS